MGLTVGVTVSAHAAIAAPRPNVGTRTVVVASGPAWRTWHAGRFLGDAQNVCLNDSSPARCPSDATVYGYCCPGWGADLSSIPDATWIWAPGIDGSTTPASKASYRFKRKITLHGAVVSGTALVAADDLARVKVNGTWVGRTGSVTDIDKAAAAAGSLKAFDITRYLVEGTNRISIWAKNGPNGFAGCSPCSYAENPAGVVFEFAITTSRG
jgi:hypothetical protein